MALKTSFQPVHKTSYAAISPTRPEQSTAGKNALVTGGGSGIGAAIARSYAWSGVSNLALLGRTAETLLAVKADIEAMKTGTKVWTYQADITDSESTRSALESFAKSTKGKVDILVANAGYMAAANSIPETDGKDWWGAFDISVRGNFILLQAFHPVAAPNATVVHVSSGAIHVPYLPHFSSYSASKLAAYKLFEHYYHENKAEKTVIQFHPGLVADTRMTKKVDYSAENVGFEPDDISLGADFAVWLASDEAKFLNGKFVWAAWDVNELKAAKDVLAADDSLLTIGLTT
ncbi:hypothetical protein ACJ41O_001191 [Fusarium nematophilum]